MQEKVFKMGQGSLLRLQNQVVVLQNELQALVHYMKP
jgi:hypothetical protein